MKFLNKLLNGSSLGGQQNLEVVEPWYHHLPCLGADERLDQDKFRR